MTHGDEFRAEQDPMLGERLRALLDPGEGAAFTARVMARLGTRVRPAYDSSWDVLANWAQPGIAAALLIATLAGAALAIREARNPDGPSAVLAEATEREDLVGVVLGSAR